MTADADGHAATAERAAILSALIHREINAGRLVPFLDYNPSLPPLVGVAGGTITDLAMLLAGAGSGRIVSDSHYRLGTELRILAKGNAETTAG